MPTLRLLVSYAAWNNAMADALRQAAAATDLEWVLDSGAYTAYYTGRTITVPQYAEFVHGLRRDITMPQPVRYITLDAIGDADATRKQFDALRALGLTPEPVYTYGASLDHLDHYLAHADVISIGGIAKGRSKNIPWLKWLFGQRPGLNRRAHVLGIAGRKSVGWLQPYSCDCSTWANSKRWHQLVVYDGHEMLQFQRRDDFMEQCRAGKRTAVLDAIKRFGIDPTILIKQATWSDSRIDSPLVQIAALSWLKFSDDAFKQVGTRVYIVASDSKDVSFLTAMYRRLHPR